MFSPKILTEHLYICLNELSILIQDETNKNYSEQLKIEYSLISKYRNSLNKLDETFHVNVEHIQKGLGLAPHPEGGFYHEFIRTDDQTVIFYLLPKNAISGWHSLKNTKEEIKLILGEELIIEKIAADGIWKSKEKVKRNENVIIEKSEVSDEFGVWFGIYTHGEYGLVTCKCTGPFEFNKFKIVDKESLNKFHTRNPEHKYIIDKLTPENLKEKTNFLRSLFQFFTCCTGVKQSEEQTLLIDPSQNR